MEQEQKAENRVSVGHYGFDSFESLVAAQDLVVTERRPEGAQYPFNGLTPGHCVIETS